MALAAEPARMAIGVAALVAARRDLAITSRGDGRAVMLMPGPFNSARSNVFLRRYLRSIGFDANGWG